MEQELIHELAAAYALDALDPSERREFEGQGLGTTWSSPDKRSSFIGTFNTVSE